MKDLFTKDWIITNALEIVQRYSKGVLTLRALHYQLVGLGMTNDIQHYKRVVTSMIDARWAGEISFDTFSDLDRTMVGKTQWEEVSVESAITEAKDIIKAWMNYYHKNRWSNQPYYPEVFIEKKALQGVFRRAIAGWEVALGACKGYPSLTFLYEAAQRFKQAADNGKTPVIIYFGDYDPSGEDIPRSIEENMKGFGVEVEVKRVALSRSQVEEWNLPPAPAKLTDTRTAAWDGIGQVELDAVLPEKIEELCEEALEFYFDRDLYQELKDEEKREVVEYRNELKKYVVTLG